MTKFDFNIGSDVTCQDETCGKLQKVVVDSHTGRVTDLVIERGFIQKMDRVLPISTVERATADTVYLAIDPEDFSQYPEYQEMVFEKPVSGWNRAKEYKADQTLFWRGRYGLRVAEQPVVPRQEYTVHEGISTDARVLEEGISVLNAQDEIGELDHVLVNRESGEILYLVVRHGIIPDYPLIPMAKVNSIREDGIVVDVSQDELETMAHYKPRDDADILSELQDRLEDAELDLSGIEAALENGIAQLTGLVSDVASKRRAEATVRSVEGVVDVENVVDTDTAITARVTSALLDHPQTSNAIIEAISEQGNVTLKGQVDSPEIREAAEEIAAEQAGVIDVINALEIEPDDDTESLQPSHRLLSSTRATAKL